MIGHVTDVNPNNAAKTPRTVENYIRADQQFISSGIIHFPVGDFDFFSEKGLRKDVAESFIDVTNKILLGLECV